MIKTLCSSLYSSILLLIRRTLLGMISIWQCCLSPLLGPRCRFYPSCSQYARESILQDSLGKALLKTSLRLLKCHPFHPGGIDLP